MNKLFKQKTQLIINNIIMPDLDINFNIKFDAADAQPVNDVTILNLTPETIRNINIGQTLILNAGYFGNLGSILVGKIKNITASNGTVDRSLKLTVTPDINVILTQNVSKSYAPGTLASYIVKDILNEVDIETGTIKLNSDIVYTNGKVISGAIDFILKQIVSETNSFLFVRCNILYITDSEYEINTGVFLNSDTGLIGSPEIIEINGATGYKIKSLLNPLLTVGSVFFLGSKYLSGLFRVQDGTHNGDFTTVVNCYPTDKVSRYVPILGIDKNDKKGENTPKGKIWTFLINKGFSKASASGVMGNIEQESNYDPTSQNSIGAYGLFQWLGTRRTNLEAYATSQSVAVSDMQLQLEYFYYEITQGDEINCFSAYGGLDAFKSASDPSTAATTFEAAFERSGGSALQSRIDYAVAVFAWNGGGSSANSTPATTSVSGGDGNFKEGAFKCECGCGLDVVPELKNKFNQLWDNVGGGIVITSGARCPYQNALVGGVPDSLHLTGEACDSYIPGGSVDYLADSELNVGLGVIRYYNSGFVHGQMYPRDTVGD